MSPFNFSESCVSILFPALVPSEIHPSILAQVRVVDLSLSSDEIRELMLTRLLQSECKELLFRHRRLRNDKQTLQEELVREEVTGPMFYHHAVCLFNQLIPVRLKR